ncbi:MAG: peptidylprolyl isomerase [Planctomycetes bacterium]|nr:peptidylprolyl isomerase [Planctomycetota bacterium]
MPTITSESRARIRTSKGDLLLKLLPEKAPRTVENFVVLAKKGFYDGLTFHRILKDFVVQGGCPNGDGSGGPGYTIRPEFNDTPHEKGVVSMARNNDPHSAGSQFFICTVPVHYLDSRFTAFAKVVEGEDVLDKIAASKVHDGNRWKERSTPLEPVYINGIDLIDIEFEPEPEPEPQPAPQGARGRPDDAEDDAEGDDGDEGGDDEGADEAPAAEAAPPEAAPARKGRGGARAKKSDDQNGLFEQAAPAEGATEEKPRRPRRKASRSKKPKDQE